MPARKSSSPVSAAAAAEPLEHRLLLAATLTHRGTLVVNGTAAGDVIVVRRDPLRTSKILATVNNVGAKFNAQSVKRIEIYGQAGADSLTLDDSLGIISARGASLFGGGGGDTLVGGLAAAYFEGGPGDDSILGSSKGDLILGGRGRDTVAGGRGDDFVSGGDDDDRLAGARGNDHLYGDAGNDSLFGEDGDDTLGGDNEDNLFFSGLGDPGNFAGNDSLNGGNGDDWLVGGRQSETLDDNNGRDTLTGGAGNDILDARALAVANNPADTITDRQAGDVVPVEDHTRTATAQEVAEGEDAYVIHDHANLFVHINDGGTMRDVVVQAGIGDFVGGANTGPRMHVHEGQEGRIHMHDLDPHVFTLGEFFRNWGVSMGADHIGRYVSGNGHTLKFTVAHNGGNGPNETIADPYNYVIRGRNLFDTGDFITITYM